MELVDLLQEESRRTLGPGEIAPTDALLQQLARTLQGLTLDEARYGIRRALANGGRLGPESVPALLEEKRLLINRSGVIEYISDTGNFDNIGGLENLKKWLLERRRLFQMRDSVSSEIVPKGVLFMGIPGLRKKPLRQSDLVLLRLATLPRRHDRDFLGTAWQARGRIRRGVPDAGRYGSCGSLVR